MTSPPQEIEILCPGCGIRFRDWYRPSINLMLDQFDDAYIDEATSAICPSCSIKVRLQSLIVRNDRTWEIRPGGRDGRVGGERNAALKPKL